MTNIFSSINLSEYLGLRKRSAVDSWFLMDSKMNIISIFLAYIYFVSNLGPKLMSKRKPFDLKYIMIIYNCIQIIFSLFICYKALKTNFILYMFQNRGCLNGLTPEAQQYFLESAWWYFLSKVIELLDTIFFVLRKKQSQISFLHVYHHSLTMLFSWIYLKYLPGEQGIVVGFLNSCVHVIMYFYYFVAALGPAFQKYLWWKNYMTQIQLVQFCIMISYMVFIFTSNCQVSKITSIFFISQVTVLLLLFNNFYKQAYLKKAPKSL